MNSYDVMNKITKRLINLDIPMHSVIAMHRNDVLYEAYAKPYDRNSVHRMFSVTKTFVAMAIGLLQEEGKLSLDDKIIDFFPDKLEGEPHPYLSAMTIRHMLTMRTCHRKTTYKLAGCTDWVGSFFTTKPSHYPGTYFAYDTSSAHVLAALVERLSGMELIEYLRAKVLDKIGFSKDAYCLKDPMGVTIGGSGLVATPMDVCRVVRLLADKGAFNGEQLLPKAYVREMLTNQSINYAMGLTHEEMMGYGYQLWMIRDGGFMLYGMGGQLGIYLPDKDLIFVTTADTQGRREGVQDIIDIFFDEINNLDEYAKTDCIDTIPEIKLENKVVTTLQDRISGKEISITDIGCELNPGFSRMRLTFDKTSGTLSYTFDGREYEITYGLGQNIMNSFPKYNHRALISGAWLDENTFLIYTQIVDEYLGKLFMQFSFNGNEVGIAFKKMEESYYKEFEYYGTGILQED